MVYYPNGRGQRYIGEGVGARGALRVIIGVRCRQRTNQVIFHLEWTLALKIN
jgi:hypothetical protein